MFVFSPRFHIKCERIKIYSQCLLLFTPLRVHPSDSDYRDEFMF